MVPRNPPLDVAPLGFARGRRGGPDPESRTPDPAPAAAQQRDVFATVLDRSGLPIPHLTPDFFAIGEGDRERTRLLEQGTARTAGGLHRVASPLAIGPELDRVRAELAATYA